MDKSRLKQKRKSHIENGAWRHSMASAIPGRKIIECTMGAFQIVALIIVSLVNQTLLRITKEQLIASVPAHYDELDALNKIDNFYDYESDFIKLWAKMGREVR